MCWPVSSSRDSAACASRRTISNWASRSSAVRSRTSPSSTADSRSRRRRSRRSARWIGDQRARGAERSSAASGATTATTWPASNASWAPTSQAAPSAERRSGRPRRRRRRRLSSGGASASDEHEQDVEPAAARSRSGKPCSAVQIALAWISGPDMSSVAARRRRMDVLQGRRGRADDDDLAAAGAEVDASRRASVARTRASGTCPALRGSRSARRRRRTPTCSAGGRSTRSAVADGERRQAEEAGREARDHAALAVVEVGRAGLRADRRAGSRPRRGRCCGPGRRPRSSRARRRRRGRSRRRARGPPRLRLLGELDVVDDLAGAARPEGGRSPAREASAGTATGRAWSASRSRCRRRRCPGARARGGRRSGRRGPPARGWRRCAAARGRPSSRHRPPPRPRSRGASCGSSLSPADRGHAQAHCCGAPHTTSDRQQQADGLVCRRAGRTRPRAPAPSLRAASTRGPAARGP